MDLGACLDAVAETKESLLCPYRESNPSRPARCEVTLLTEPSPSDILFTNGLRALSFKLLKTFGQNSFRKIAHIIVM
jgi:hypothetical protein